MTRDSSYVLCHEIEHLFVAVCEKCDYKSVHVSTEEAAKSLLRRHRTTRQHKTNIVAAHRFAV